MRLLLESENPDQLNQTKELLESKGIPAFISGEESFRLRPMLVLYKKGLWICLDEQFRDAVELLKNPNHRVAQPVDVDAFHQSLEERQRKPFAALELYKDKILNTVLVFATAAIVLAVVAAMLLK